MNMYKISNEIFYDKWLSEKLNTNIAVSSIKVETAKIEEVEEGVNPPIDDKSIGP